MPYKDPLVRKQKASERARRRWAQIKENPERLKEYRAKRAAHERKRRERDPFRGKSQEEFLADARRYQSARRARKRNQFVEHVDPQTVLTTHESMCGICGLEITGEFHVDHIVPLAQGGPHSYDNVQPAHPLCNWKKGNRV